VARERAALSDEELEALLTPYRMTEPGLPGTAEEA
jgi:hypothetical protein